MPHDDVPAPAPAAAPSTVRSARDGDPPAAAPEAAAVGSEMSPRSTTLGMAVIATSLLVAGMSLLPAPYAVSSPGPTRDTLGDVDGDPLITIDGPPTFESSGELRLTTVANAGGPGFDLNAVRVVREWFNPHAQVRPVEDLFDQDVTREQIREHTMAEMITSQETAAVAALEELGYDVPTTLTVAGVSPGSGAEGVVREGDVVVEFEGQEVSSFSALSALISEVPVGTRVTVGVLRDGVRHDLSLVTSDDGEGGSMLGVLIDPTFDLPFEIDIQIDDIGGPSAGMMFALGIIDRLTEQDETNGVSIAGTGTIDIAGEVGAISGIRHKLVGAVRDGATWFLAPEQNCGEVVGHVPDGIQVVRVGTLSEARAAVEAIGAGEGADLPTCEP